MKIIGKIILILFFFCHFNYILSQEEIELVSGSFAPLTSQQEFNITYSINEYNYYDAYDKYFNLVKTNTSESLDRTEIILPDHSDIEQFELCLNKMLKRCKKSVKQNNVESNFTIKIIFLGYPIVNKSFSQTNPIAHYNFRTSSDEWDYSMVAYTIGIEIFDNKPGNILIAKMKDYSNVFATGQILRNKDYNAPSSNSYARPGTIMHVEYNFKSPPTTPKQIKKNGTELYQRAGKVIGKFICEEVNKFK